MKQNKFKKSKFTKEQQVLADMLHVHQGDILNLVADLSSNWKLEEEAAAGAIVGLLEHYYDYGDSR